MITQAQSENIKKQLMIQLESLDIPNKEEIKKSIKSMNPEQLEQFLKDNNISIDSKSQTTPKTQKCIFCSIAFNEMPSYKISENQNAVAVLELNPVSKGHTLIIPKAHSEKIKKEVFEFAEKISKTLKTKLTPKEVIIQNSNMFGHEILNIIPVYKDENINSLKQKAEEKTLLELQKLLEEKQEPKKPLTKKSKPKIIKESDAKNLWLPKRIP